MNFDISKLDKLQGVKKQPSKFASKFGKPRPGAGPAAPAAAKPATTDAPPAEPPAKAQDVAPPSAAPAPAVPEEQPAPKVVPAATAQPPKAAAPRPTVPKPAPAKPSVPFKPPGPAVSAAEKAAAAAPPAAAPAAEPESLAPTDPRLAHFKPFITAAQPSRNKKRTRKQLQPKAAAAETPGGLDLQKPSKATKTAARTTASARGRPKKSAAPAPVEEEESGPAVVSRAQAAVRKKATKAAAAAAAAQKEAAAVVASSPAKKRGRPRKDVAEDVEEAAVAGKPMRLPAAPPERSARPRRAATTIKKESDFVVDFEDEEDEEIVVDAPVLFNSREKARAAAQRVGHRMPSKRQKRTAAELEDAGDHTYDSQMSSSDEEEAAEDGSGPSELKSEDPGGAWRPSKKGKKSKGKALKKVTKPRRILSSIADRELDTENWSLRDIVKWGNSHERKLAKKEKIERQRQAALKASKEAGGEDQIAEEDMPSGSGRPAVVSPVQQLEGGGQRAPILAPQVQVIDGKIVVNRQSLTIQAQEREQYTRVVTEDASRLNSLSYMNRLSNERWTTEDTELFYKALSQFGTDFTLITHLFPGRHRRHLKNKYTRESKLHPDRVDEALRASANATINSYKDMIMMLKEAGMEGANGGGDGGVQAIETEAPPLQITNGRATAAAAGRDEAGPSSA